MEDLVFTYEHHDGSLGVRRVVDWIDHPTYIFGYCAATGDPKSFSKMRIVEWCHDPIGVHDPYVRLRAESEAAKAAAIAARKIRRPDILFTGFLKAHRAELESRAQESGLIVRKVVTRDLTVLVAGPNAGWAKLKKASQMGSAIISADDCEDLFKFGLLP